MGQFQFLLPGASAPDDVMIRQAQILRQQRADAARQRMAQRLRTSSGRFSAGNLPALAKAGGVAPGMEIMPYTGPGSAIVPKPPTTVPPVPPPTTGGGGMRGLPPGGGPLAVFGGGGRDDKKPKLQSDRQQADRPGTTKKAPGPSSLSRFIGPAFLGLMGIDLLTRAGESRRQKEMMLQQLGMMGLTGGAQYGDQLGALAMGQNYSNVVGGMGALAEGMQIPSASELELSLLLGKSGAMAAQKAAVAPQMDELALDYVLGMT